MLRELKKTGERLPTLSLTRTIFAYCGQSYIIFCASPTRRRWAVLLASSSFHHAKGAIPQVGRLGNSSNRRATRETKSHPVFGEPHRKILEILVDTYFHSPSASTGTSINLLVVLNIFCRINKLQWEHQHIICVFSCRSLQC